MSNSLPALGLYSLPGSSVLGILQARILEWVAISFSRESSPPRDRTGASCTAGGCLPPELQGKHMVVYIRQHSLSPSHPLLPSVSTVLLCLHLYSCPENSSPAVFPDSTYMCVLAHNIWFSLSDLLHSVWQALGSSTSLQVKVRGLIHRHPPMPKIGPSTLIPHWLISGF